MSVILKRNVCQGDDFKVIITLIRRNGVPLNVKMTEFKFIYKDIYGNSYEISRIGEKRLNNYLDVDRLVGVFEKYQLANGVLKREEWYWAADAAFSDGSWDYGNTHLSNIELSRDGGAKEIEETVDVPDPIYINETLVVSKGDPFRYEDFTTSQLNALKGETGNSGVYVLSKLQGDDGLSVHRRRSQPR